MVALIISNSVLVIGIVLFIITDCIDKKRPIVIKEAKYLREYYDEKLRVAEANAAEDKESAARYKGLYEEGLEKSREADNIKRKLDLALAENAVLQDKNKELTKENESLEATIEEMAKENQSLKKAKTKSGAKKK